MDPGRHPGRRRGKIDLVQVYGPQFELVQAHVLAVLSWLISELATYPASADHLSLLIGLHAGTLLSRIGSFGHAQVTNLSTKFFCSLPHKDRSVCIHISSVNNHLTPLQVSNKDCCISDPGESFVGQLGEASLKTQPKVEPKGEC
jgi:hypothetical protein